MTQVSAGIDLRHCVSFGASRIPSLADGLTYPRAPVAHRWRPALHAPRGVVRREALGLLELAWPLVVSNFSLVAIQVTDSMMIGRLGAAELGAVGLASHLSLAVSLVYTGTLEAVSPLVARERGRADQQTDAIRSTVQHGLLLGLLLCLPLCVLLWDSAWLFRASGQAEQVAQIGRDYLRVFLFAIPAMVVFTGLRGFLVGMELSRLVLWTSVATVVVNFLGNWVLIYGHLGAPALGVQGAALSIVIASVCAVLMLAVISASASSLRGQRHWARCEAFEWRRLLEIARLGLPIGLILFVEIAFFTTIAVLVGQFGVAQLAAHEVAIQLVAVTFMFPLAIAQAAAVRVARRVGAGDATQARTAVLVPVLVSSILMMVLSAVLWLAAPWLTSLFLGAGVPPDDTTFRYVVVFLRIAALLQLFDGLQETAAGVLRGAGDTLVPLGFACVAYWLVGVPAAVLLSGFLGLEAEGVWIGVAGAEAACALFMLSRVVRLLRSLGRHDPAVRHSHLPAIRSHGLHLHDPQLRRPRHGSQRVRVLPGAWQGCGSAGDGRDFSAPSDRHPARASRGRAGARANAGGPDYSGQARQQSGGGWPGVRSVDTDAIGG